MTYKHILTMDDASLISTAQKLYGQGHMPGGNQLVFGQAVQELKTRGYQVTMLGRGYGHLSIQAN